MNYKLRVQQWETLLGRDIRNQDEFLSGVMDAREGSAARDGMGEEYISGYSAMYQVQELHRNPFVLCRNITIECI